MKYKMTPRQFFRCILLAWCIVVPSTHSASTKPSSVAEARERWPFKPPAHINVPQTQDKIWPRNELDYFIRAKLEEKKLLPSRPAEKRALIRRATYDLTGLPPTPEDVEAFLSDRSD